MHCCVTKNIVLLTDECLCVKFIVVLKRITSTNSSPYSNIVVLVDHDAALKPKLSRYWSECSRRSGSELVTSSPFCPRNLLIQWYTATPMMYTSGIRARMTLLIIIMVT